MSAQHDLEKGVNPHHHGTNAANNSSRDFATPPGDGYKHGEGVSRHITPGGHPEDRSQPAFPVYHRKLANPSPLGLMAFAISTFLLSMYNAQFRGITVPNVILGVALAVGGLGEFIAGIQEFIVGNTFGATVFVIFAGFWTSLSMIYMPTLGIIDAYGSDIAQLNNALGLYLWTWFAVAFIFTLTILRSSVPLVGLFVALDITFATLASGYLNGNVACFKAGGAFGIVSAACGAYAALASMLTPETGYFMLPVGDLSGSK